MNRAQRRAAERYRRRHGTLAAIKALGLEPELRRRMEVREKAVRELLEAQGLMAALEQFAPEQVERVLMADANLLEKHKDEMRDYLAKNKEKT